MNTQAGNTLEPAAFDKPMTIQQVARELGVSPSTVSAAFSGKGTITAQRRVAVLESARALGYEPNPVAQRLRNGRCPKTVGLFSLGLDFGVATRKIQIIQRLLSAQGYGVPLYVHSAGNVVQQSELMLTLRRQQPRAIICATRNLHPDTLAELEKYRGEGGIVVCYDEAMKIDCDQVEFDREDNNYQTARHLLELGHRDLGFYMERLSPDGPRFRGFERALHEDGLQKRDEWLFSGGPSENGGMLLAQQFLKLKRRPTALCVVNDHAASAFVNAVLRAGLRVPEDVSVACHDDEPVTRSSMVSLTSGTQPVQKIAEQVVQLLLSRLDGSYCGPPRSVQVRGELIVRDSTGSVPVMNSWKSE